MFIGEHDDGTITEIESRDVTFLKNEFLSISKVDNDIHLYELNDSEINDTYYLQIERNLNMSGNSDFSGSQPQNEFTPHDNSIRRSNRTLIPRRSFKIEGEAFMIDSNDGDEPRTYSEAITSLAKELWIKVMDEEMESMRSNHVWDVVDLLPNCKAIENKYVLRVKRKADGTIEIYKARLVAKGYIQQESIDYEETFSSVVRIVSIRLILAIVAHMDFELHQMDVKTTFLNRELNEKIYMEQPKGL